MENYIIPAVIGIICIVLGVLNTKGNISSLHRYHRSRVSEEDRIPFGKKVGLGTIIIGASIVLYSVSFFAAEVLTNDLFALVGTVVMIIGIVAGLGLSFYAMIKYNKGIF